MRSEAMVERQYEAVLAVNHDEAARMIGVSATQLFNMRAAGRFPVVPLRFGKRCVRFRVAEIDQWLAAGCPPADRWRQTRRESTKYDGT